MPNIRLVLVHLFPKVLGSSTIKNSRNDYINSNGLASQNGGVITANRTRNFSRAGEGQKGITMSKTYAVQYPEEDELELTSMGHGEKPPPASARSF